jgi:predicted transcriptional regulator
MARPASTLPTERELDILQVLWDAGAASLSEISSVLHNRRGVATTTVATILKVMLDKGLVRRTKDRRWEASVSQDDTGQGMVSQLLDRVFHGSAQRMVGHILAAGDLSEQDVRELRQLLDEYRAKSQSKGNKKA